MGEEHDQTESPEPDADPVEKIAEPVEEDGAPLADALVADGNPVRWWALAVALGAALAGTLVMASRLSPRWVVPLGSLAVALVAWAVLDFLGSFDDRSRESEDATPHSQTLRRLADPAVLLLGAAAGHILVLRLAVDGALGVATSALLVPLTFLTLVVAAYWLGVRLGPWRQDELGELRPLWRRHGFWLVLAASVIYLPMLGNHGLVDPWETHYGEVAREILARNDWISLWWAQDGWFWSKPVLTFWVQAVAMALLGVRYEPGAMLSAVAEGRVPQPEWAVRMPIFLMTLLGVYLLYKGVARVFGRTAGLCGALVLLTAPQFFLVSHQTMTDMPFVACMAGAVGLVALALGTDPDERCRSWPLRIGGRRLELSLYHLVVGAILLLTVPQILYLLSRNLHVSSSPWQLAFVSDTFTSGSVGNCEVPGNAPCQADLVPVVKSLEPVIQALIWTQVLSLVLWLCWGERRRQRLFFLAAWLLLGLSTMAKGPAGLGLPLLATLGCVIATGRWRDLTRMEIPAGLLLFAAVVLPWGVAMYVRHGPGFTDRLLFHDMFKRAFEHVHDTNRGDDVGFRYYPWQLGYALFPWTGLAAMGAVRWLRSPAREGAPGTRYAVAALFGSWFFIGLGLFTLMGTKFHHYSLPIVPPLAMLTGVVLADMLKPNDDSTPDRSALLGAVAVVAAIVTYFVGRDLYFDAPGRLSQIRLLHLFTYNYDRPWPGSIDLGQMLAAFVGAATLLTLALAIGRIRRQMVLALSGLALVFAAWGIDVYLVRLSPHWGQRELLLAYERERLAEPGELVAYQMNWKGENFYRGNRVPAYVSSGRGFQDWIAEEKKNGARVFYFLTEHKRINGLRNELSRPSGFEELTDERLNNKFLLIRVRFDDVATSEEEAPG